MDIKRPLGFGVATFAVLVGLGAMYLASPFQGTREVPPGGEARATAAGASEEPTNRGGARRPDRPSEPLRSSEGLARPSLSPAHNGRLWQERRVMAALGWRERERAAIERFADEHGLSPEVRTELLAIEEQRFEEMAAARSDLEAGRLQDRERLKAARDVAREAIIALLGETDAALLEQQIAAAARP